MNDLFNIAFKIKDNKSEKESGLIKSEERASTSVATRQEAIRLDEEPDTYSVILEAFGEHFTIAVLAVKTMLHISMDESRDLVKSAPCIMANGLDSETAAQMAKELEEKGISAGIARVEPLRRVLISADYNPEDENDKKLKLKAIGILREFLEIGTGEAKTLIEKPEAVTPELPRTKASELLTELMRYGVSGQVIK